MRIPRKKLIGLVLCALPLAGAGFLMVDLQPQTVAAFDRYERAAEERADALGRARHLWLDEDAARRSQVRKGDVVAEPASGNGSIEVPGGLIQDWVGAMFVPGRTLDDVLALVRNYGLQKEIYKPEVVESTVVSRDGDHFIVRLRLLKKKLTTLVLDVTEDVRYDHPAPDFAYNVTRATRIAEVQNAGKPDERELEPGKDHGFLWRMNSYWRFAQTQGGAYVECEVISLTRGLPAGSGWLIGPIVHSLPKDSLVKTLRETRDALTRR